MAKRTETVLKQQNPQLDREQLIIKEAKQRFDDCVSHWKKYRKQAKESLEFINGEQYDKTYRDLKEAANLPVLTALS